MTDTTDPLAHVKAGDAARAVLTERPEVPACAAGNGYYVCTRADGHPGQHIATGTYEVIAVWPAQPETGATA